MISYGRQFIDSDDIKEVVKVLKSDWLTQGQKVLEFEKKIAEYCGAKYAVAVSSGTAALHCAYFAAGFGKNDEIIISPNTFVATANAALYLGAKPVFCDIRLDTYNIDENKIEELINNLPVGRREKLKAIVPVHFAGQPCEMEKIRNIAKKYNLVVIEDACHALGAKYKDSKIGSCKYSDMAVFSFHPVKPITTGEGGAIVTDNKKYYEKLLEFRTHGITKNTGKMAKNDGPWYYEMQELGYNYRITDIQCALGISQMNKIDKFIKKRRQIVKHYEKGLKTIKNIILPTELLNNYSGWHIYVIQLNLEGLKYSRRQIFARFKKEGIGVQVHYIPIYLQPYYTKNFDFKEYDLPAVEKYYQQAITLPVYYGMSNKDIDLAVKAANKIIK